MGRIYLVNPSCPCCGEEHVYWNIQLTDEEQAVLDAHTESQKGLSSLQSLLSPLGLYVKRKLKCCCGVNLKQSLPFGKSTNLAGRILIFPCRNT